MYRILPCLLVFLAATSATAQGESAPHLALTLVRALPVPDSHAASQVVVSDAGIVAWSPRESSLLFASPTDLQLQEIPLPSGEAVRFIVSEGTVFHVLDRSGTEWLLDASGELQRDRSVAMDLPVLSAARIGGTWYFGRVGEAGTYTVRREDSRSGTPIFRADGATAPGERQLVHVGSSGADLLLTEMRSPFQVHRMNPRNRFEVVFEAPAVADDGLWTSLPAVPLDRGLLQTLTDLRSDRRLLVLYDRDGRVARATTLDAPIGFTSALPTERRLVGLRAVQGREVVVYRWEWIINPTPEGDLR